MKLTQRDLPRLKGTLILSLSLLAAGAGALFGANRFLASAQRELAAAGHRAAQARQKLEQVKEEGHNLSAYYAEYQALRLRGVIGEENRLDWIEAIEGARERRHLFAAKYAISPQQPFQPGFPFPGSSLSLRASEMKLTLTLLHEGQLVAFFDDLRAQAKGLYLLQGCRIGRIAAARELTYGPQLSADCTLLWVTLKDTPPHPPKEQRP